MRRNLIVDKALKGSVIPDWHIMPLHFYGVNHDNFVGLVPNRVYFIPTFRKSADKNKIFYPNSYQLLSIFYFKKIPEFFEGLDIEYDHGNFLDVTNAKFDDCSFWIEPEYLVEDKFKLLHVESLRDLEVPIKALEVDVKRKRKLLDKAYRNLALKKNSDFEFLSTLIDDKIDVNSGNDDSECDLIDDDKIDVNSGNDDSECDLIDDKIDVNSGNDDSECDDIEVGLVDDEGFEKMCRAFHHTEKMLNWYKNLLVRIKVKLEDLNGADCLLPRDSVVEKGAPESVFNIMKTTGTDIVLGGAQPEIATSEEPDSMVGALVNPKKPFAAIIGGSKMSSKIGLIEPLLAKLDILVLGGGTVFTFYKAQGFSVGSSFVEEDKLDLANSLLEKAKVHNVLILFPTDLVIADKYAADANSKIVPVSSIPDGWMGLDIGPDSVTKFSETLDEAVTVIWNGPMGVVEFEKFSVGTKAIVTKLAKLSSRKGVRTFIGGGDSIAVVEKAGLADRMIYKSTGGTVGLEYLWSLLINLADRMIYKSTGGTVGLELLVELAADKTI